VDAGERLVRKKGFGVSVDEIAAEAGYTKGAVYSNFTSRAELIAEVCQRVVPGLQVEFDTSLPTLAEALEDTGRQEVLVTSTDAEQIVLQVDALVQMLRDSELRDALLQATFERERDHPEPPLPWPLPIEERQWNIAVNAVAIGLIVQRLLFGAEEVPDELFVWLNRRLAGD
jgi:AcrR family transcriptional regulator